MVKQTRINSARVGVNRDMITWKEARSPRGKSHQFRKLSISKVPEIRNGTVELQTWFSFIYDRPGHYCRKYAARKGESCRIVARCQIVSFNERGNSSRGDFMKVTIGMSELGETHSRLSNCQTFSLSSVELHGRDVVT